MRQLVLAALTAVVFVPNAVRAQGEEPAKPARPEARFAAVINPLALVVDHKADVKLLPDQVVVLDSMRSALAEENRPLDEQVRSVMAAARPHMKDEASQTVEDRDVVQVGFERMRKIREQVEKNNKAAWKDAAKLLTKDQ